ncbi:hypothetical protein [Ideonella sp. BN130291]|uniref:hypothetical protein n=1 Tax=Ideonella sp. BN130291 TaxID=3112940 RepID=UPI002E25E479|nr:hypothetical protein [Ideonella sp. BN130291]
MLRAALALVLAANLVFYAWSHGWLDSLAGSSGHGEREPERLQRQVHPEVVQLLPAQAARAAASAPANPQACLQAGPYTDAEMALAEGVLRAAGLPAGRWNTPAVDRPGAWLLYMGRFADREALQKKEGELQRIRVPYEELRGTPELEPGLALGRFSDRAAADAALDQLAQRGVRTARIVTLTAPARLHLLRVNDADAALQAQLLGLKAPALGNGFSACATGG